MAPRKRKVVQPKQAAEVQVEPELSADGEADPGSPPKPEGEATEPEISAPEEADEADLGAKPEGEASVEGEAEPEAEAEAAPESESERVTLPPHSRVKGSEPD